MLLAGEMTERTDGGRCIVVAGRRWRTADPMIHAYLPGTAPQALAALDSSCVKSASTGLPFRSATGSPMAIGFVGGRLREGLLQGREIRDDAVNAGERENA